MERACRRSSLWRTLARSSSDVVAARTRWPIAMVALLVDARDDPSSADRDAGHLGDHGVRDAGRDFDRRVFVADIHAAELRLRDAGFIRDRADEIAGLHVVHRADVEVQPSDRRLTGRDRDALRLGA